MFWPFASSTFTPSSPAPLPERALTTENPRKGTKLETMRRHNERMVWSSAITMACVSNHRRSADTLHFVTHEAHRQGKQVYRVDIDFRNTFNAMSQAALWHVMNMFHIPDVDLLEQIYDSATVRLAPNDAGSATITFDTGVAQGSIMSPQLFKTFINALLLMLTANWQN